MANKKNKKQKAMKFADTPKALFVGHEVPQADKLSTIRKFAEAVNLSVASKEGLKKATGLSDRHLAYYRRAAEVLEILVEDENKKLSLGPFGEKLVETVTGSNGERQVFLDAILASKPLKPFRSLFEVDELPKEQVVHRIIAMTGMSENTAKRRASTLVAWRKYVAPKVPLDAQGPIFDDITSELETRIATHNELVKEQYLAWLRGTLPSRFEEIVTALVAKLPNYSNVIKVGGSGDGGVDIRATKTGNMGTHQVIIQVKRYAKNVQSSYVVNLIGAKNVENCPEAVLITTSGFSKGALEKASLVQGVHLIGGERLLELMVDHGIGLTYGRYGEIVRTASSADGPDADVLEMQNGLKAASE